MTILIMDTGKIEAQKVTKPIQLLAAWLIGLITIDAAFLAASLKIDGWEKSLLVIAAVLNVPIFLFALFLLQTRFRPELQEDAFYSKYLDTKTNQVVTKNKFDAIEGELSSIKKLQLEIRDFSIKTIGIKKTIIGRGSYKVALNKHLKNLEGIKEILGEKDIKINDVFGADEAPIGNYMAVDEDMSYRATLAAISLEFDCGLDGYGYFNSTVEEISEKILIGAYGIHNDHIPLTQELKEFLDTEPELNELTAYEQAHKVVLDAE